MFSSFAISLGLPSVYTSFWGEYVSKDVVVIKLDFRRRKGCDYKIKVEGYRKRFCTHRRLFERLAVGDKIHIYGNETRFGFKLKSFGLITKQ